MDDKSQESGAGASADESYALTLKKQCIINLYLQSKSAKFYNAINNLITFPNIVIGGIMSITIFSTSNTYWKITSGALAIASTILSSLSKQLGAGERAQLHCTMVRHYNSLINDLNIFTHSPCMSSADKKNTMERIRQHMNKLFDMQPEPSSWAVRNFEKRYKTFVETALFDDFETAALRSAHYVEKRLSRIKPVSSSSAQANGSPDTSGASRVRSSAVPDA